MSPVSDTNTTRARQICHNLFMVLVQAFRQAIFTIGDGLRRPIQPGYEMESSD